MSRPDPRPDPDAPAPPPRRSRLRRPFAHPGARLATALVLSLGLGVGGLVLALPDAFGRDLPRALARLDALEVASLVGMVGLWWLLSGWRLVMLARGAGERLPLVGAVQAHVVGVFSAVVTPAGGGNSLGIALLLRRLGLRTETAVAAAVMYLVGDMAFFGWAVAVGGIALHVARIDLGVPGFGLGVTALSAVALGSSWLLAFRLDLVAAAVRRVSGRPLLRRAREPLEAFLGRLELAGARYARRPWSWHVRFHLLSGAARVVYFLVLDLVLVALGVDAPHVLVLAAQVVVHAFAFVVPTPGASGYQELAMTAVLRTGASGAGLLSAAVILWRALQHYLYFVAGPLLGGAALLAGGGERVQERSAGERDPV